MKLQEVTLYESRSHRVLKEGWQDLNEWQKNYINDFERQMYPIILEMQKVFEAELTPQQIDAIFKNAETVAMQGGANRTGIGKAGDTVAKGAKLTADAARVVKQKYDEIKNAALDSGPVEKFDQKFEDLKSQIREKLGGDDSKVVQTIEQMGQWAKDNPGKASIVVAALTVVASVGAGASFAPIAAGVLTSASKLLKGEKLSKSIVAGLEVGAVSWLAGQAIDAIGDTLASMAEKAVIEPVTDMTLEVDKLYSINGWMPENMNYNFKYDLITTNEALAEKFVEAFDKANRAYSAGQYDLAKETFELLQTVADQATNDAIANMSDDAFAKLVGDPTSIKQAFDQVFGGLQSAAAAAAAGAASYDKEGKPVDDEGNPVTDETAKKEESIDLNKEFDRYLQEAGFADMIKGAGAKVAQGAKAAGGAIAKGAKAAGKELGNKATYNKMMSAWKKAGKPSDTGSIINILQGLGMSPEQIQSVGDEQGVELKAKNVGDADEPVATDTPTTNPADDSTAQGKDAAPAAQIKPGDTKEIKGKTYKWEGALWTDTSTGRSVGIQAAVSLGLPNPKIDPVRDAIKAAGPNVIKLVIDQINSKGVKAGTKDAQKAKAAGAKGTEELPAAQNEKPKAGIAKPGTVAAKPKKVRGKV
jgi:hypothetical protein